MSDKIIQKSVYLNATPEQVWAYLTDPDKLAIWFHRPTEALTNGVKYEMTHGESGECFMWGTVLAADPPNRLEYEFCLPQMGDKISNVSWDIEQVVGGVRLSLVHSNLLQDAEMFGLMLALDKGWEEHIGRMRTSLHDG